jgi:branched-chain amino acid transport system permease protein
MDVAVQQVVNGLALGGTYAMLALGLAVVFSVMKMINFAHGELMTVSGYAYAAAVAFGLPFLLGVVLAMAVGAVMAVVLERAAFRPLRGSSPTTLLITSFAVSIVLQTLFQNLISPRPQPAPVPEFFNQALTLGGFRIGSIQTTSILVTAVTLGLLVVLFRMTTVGIAIRAASMDFRTTRLMGVRADLVISMSFAISGLLAAISGLLWVAQRGSVDPLMGFIPVLKAFICAVLGGLGSLPGAVLGGFVLGAIETALQATLPIELAAFKDPFAFLAVIAILAVRPRGLIPVKSASRA